MKFHGLVIIAILNLTTGLWAQNGSTNLPPNYLPPIPHTDEQSAPAETVPAINAPVNVEAELQKLRNELRQLQTMQEDISRDMKSTDVESERVASEQRQELLSLVTKLARDGAARKAAAAARALQARQAAPVEPAVTEPAADQSDQSESDESSQQLAIDSGNPLVNSDIADAFALGKVLFNKGEFVSAEKAFRKAKVSPENEMALKYLIATCLRRQAKWRAAVEVYKVVAESDQDPVLKKLAKWQLDHIRSDQESESQLEQLRKQRELRTEPPKSAAKSNRTSTQ